jgi:uncharacterized protein GlcG (DUF336 family)
LQIESAAAAPAHGRWWSATHHANITLALEIPMKFSVSGLSLAVALAFGACAGPANADLADRKMLTNVEAKNAMKAAIDEAVKNNWKVVIAITDDAGRLVLLERMDGVQAGSIGIAQGKARTSALFNRNSAMFEEALKNRPALATLGENMLQGGVPIFASGQIIGAIGVSGVTSQQDEQIAKAGVAAIKGADAPK